MTKMRDCVEHLADVIGARPVGTDEEQQAALYIEGILKDESNLDVELQEFQAATQGELLRAIFATLCFVGALLGVFSSSLLIIGLTLAIVGTALFVLDEFDIFSLKNSVSRGPSQNVVGKYIPKNAQTSGSARKIVILTNYDSEKINPAYKGNFFKYMGKIKIVELVCVCLVFLSLLLSLLLGRSALISIFLVVGAIGSFLPILGFIFHATSQYNSAANNNASSIAVQMEVAKRLTTGIYMPEGEVPIIHGEKQAKSEDVILPGTEVEWPEGFSENEKGETQEFAPVNAESVTEEINEPQNQHDSREDVAPAVNNEAALVQQNEEINTESKEVSDETIHSAINKKEFVAKENVEEKKEDVPDWFSRGRTKAGVKVDAPHSSEGVKRSVFSDALQAANNPAQTDNDKSDLEIKQEKVKSDLEKQLDAIHAQIESAGQKAVKKAKDDAAAAENVLNNELSLNEEAVKNEEEAEPQEDVILRENAKPEPLKPIEELVKKDPETKEGVTGFLEKVTDAPNYETAQHKAIVVEDKENSDNTIAMSDVKPQDDVSEAQTHHEKKAPKRDIQLPSLTGAFEAQKVKQEESKRFGTNKQADRKERISSLGQQIPSLTGVMPAQKQDVPEEKNELVSAAGAFAVGDATGAFAPVGDELVAGAKKEDIYVMDADDEIYQNATTESGAVAGPGYVDIPETRTESVFGRVFRKKKKQAQSDISSENVGVESSKDSTSIDKYNQKDNTFNFDDEDEWEGGAVGYENQQEARDDIYTFATNDLKKEVWIVSLGAEYSSHAGLEAFLEKYNQDLKGALFVCLDAVGVGELSLVETEGTLIKKAISPRMKRIARQSAKTVGLDLPTQQMSWKDSTAYILAKKGYSQIHIGGFEGEKLSLYSEQNDSSQNVEDDVMQDCANLVMEILRTSK